MSKRNKAMLFLVAFITALAGNALAPVMAKQPPYKPMPTYPSPDDFRPKGGADCCRCCPEI